MWGAQDDSSLAWQQHVQLALRGKRAAEATAVSPAAWATEPLASLPIHTLHGGCSGAARSWASAQRGRAPSAGTTTRGDCPAAMRSSFLHRAPLMENDMA